jgi:hypothetical protein
MYACPPLIPTTLDSISGIGGAECEVIGKLRVSIGISGFNVNHMAYVARRLAFPLIVGNDILRPHQVVLRYNWAGEVAELREPLCDFCNPPERSTDSIEEPELVRVGALRDSTVPPHTAMFIRAQLPEQCTGDWATDSIDNSRYHTLPGLFQTNGDGEDMVLVLNETGDNVDIQAGETVAQAFRVGLRDPPATGAVFDCAPARIEKFERVTRELNVDGLNVSAITRINLRGLIKKNLDVFSVHELDVGKVDRVYHQIHTGDHAPVRQPVRRLAYGAQREEVEKQVDNLLGAGLIRPSNSPWASPIVLVRKKDGTVRMCVDYRLLNSIAKMDSFPLPRLDETLDSFMGTRFFRVSISRWGTTRSPSNRTTSKRRRLSRTSASSSTPRCRSDFPAPPQLFSA